MQKLNKEQIANISGGDGCFCTCKQNGISVYDTPEKSSNEQDCQDKCNSLGYDDSRCTRTPNAPVRTRPVAGDNRFAGLVQPKRLFT